MENLGQDHVETEKCTEYLACVLTEKELIERAQELAKANEDLSAAEDKKKDLMADVTAQIKRHEANIGLLSRVVSQGKEYRNVECVWEKNYTIGKKTLSRTDTWEIIKSADIDKKERQAPLV